MVYENVLVYWTAEVIAYFGWIPTYTASIVRSQYEFAEYELRNNSEKEECIGEGDEVECAEVVVEAEIEKEAADGSSQEKEQAAWRRYYPPFSGINYREIGRRLGDLLGRVTVDTGDPSYKVNEEPEDSDDSN